MPVNKLTGGVEHKLREIAEGYDFYYDPTLKRYAFDVNGYNPVPYQYIDEKKKEFKKFFPHISESTCKRYFYDSTKYIYTYFFRNFLKNCGTLYNPEMPLFESVAKCIDVNPSIKLLFIESLKRFFLHICSKNFSPHAQVALAFKGENLIADWLCRFPFGIAANTNNEKKMVELLGKNLVVKFKTRIGRKRANFFTKLQLSKKSGYFPARNFTAGTIIQADPESRGLGLFKNIRFYYFDVSEEIFDISIVNFFGWAYHECFKTTLI